MMKTEPLHRLLTPHRSTKRLLCDLLMAAALFVVIMALTNCASTTLHDRSGRKIADFQGDMTGVEYSMAADGSIKWKAATVDHSAATLAQGEAAKDKINAVGAGIAASGLTLLLK